ncbi:hypothetical protein [Helicovermis profundi]
MKMVVSCISIVKSGYFDFVVNYFIFLLNLLINYTWNYFIHQSLVKID